MRWLGGFLLVLLASGVGAAPAPSPVPLERTLSSSEQFAIYHQDKTLRSRLARRAETLKGQFLEAIQQEDDWKHSIIIQPVSLRPKGYPSLLTSLYESDGGAIKIQINVYDPSALRTPEFDLEVYRALALEFAYRDFPPKVGKSFNQPPPWLLYGLLEDANAKNEGVSAKLYEGLIDKGPPPKLDAFLKERPERMDATSRAIFRAQAMAVLRSLQSLPGGKKHLATYLLGLKSTNPADARALLAGFPGLADDPAGLAKLWTLTLAKASATDRAKPFRLEETEKQLVQILDMAAPKNPKDLAEGLISGPAALGAVAKTDAGKYIMLQKSEDLMRLEVRSHPLLRPIVEEYRLIAVELSLRPKKNLEKRIQQNTELRQAIVQRSSAIGDYLNWYQVAKMDTPDRELQEITETADGPVETLRRTDAVSRHLDDIEARGW